VRKKYFNWVSKVLNLHSFCITIALIGKIISLTIGLVKQNINFQFNISSTLVSMSIANNVLAIWSPVRKHTSKISCTLSLI
jgi:hypothetical protein